MLGGYLSTVASPEYWYLGTMLAVRFHLVAQTSNLSKDTLRIELSSFELCKRHVQAARESVTNDK